MLLTTVNATNFSYRQQFIPSFCTRDNLAAAAPHLEPISGNIAHQCNIVIVQWYL